MGVHPVHTALTTDYAKRLLKVKARQLVRRSEFRRFERSDIEQELATYVIQKAHLYDTARSSVHTFIARVVDSAVAIMIRHQHRVKRAAGLSAWSLDGTVFGKDEDVTPLSALITETDLCRRHSRRPLSRQRRHELEADLHTAMKGLSPDLQEIALRLMGGSEVSIARDLGISRRQVRNAMAKVREHFEGVGLAEKPGSPGQAARRRHR